MAATHPKFKAAAVQAASVMHDLDAGVEKAIGLIEQAAREGCQLINFPETWLPGYPYWAWLGPPAYAMQFVQAYHDNSVVVGGKEYQAICDAARRNSIHVVMGYSEKAGGSLFLAQTMIGPDGEVIANRRKLRPTHVERTIYGDGDGQGFVVEDTDIGRLGGLCCWEHLQPLSKYAMYSMNEQVHCAAWPTLSLYEGKAYALGPEANMAVSRVYALEGQCFVVAATSIMTQEVHEALGVTPEQADLIPLGGGVSSIFAPDGQQIGAQLPHDQEGLVTAELDLGMISLAKAAADPAGHYARPDVTQLLLHREARTPVVYAESLNPVHNPAEIYAAIPQEVGQDAALSDANVRA